MFAADASIRGCDPEMLRGFAARFGAADELAAAAADDGSGTASSADANVRSDRDGASSRRPARKGLAEASITFEGAGAGPPSRKVANSMRSSLPSIGARPTYSTRTRARPCLWNSKALAVPIERSITRSRR